MTALFHQSIFASWDKPVGVQDNPTNSSLLTNISSQNISPSKPAVPKWVGASHVPSTGIYPIADIEANAHWPVPTSDTSEQHFFDQTQMQILTQAELDLHCTTMAADDSNTDTEKDMEHSILFHAIAELETTTGRVEPSQLKHQTKGLHKSRTKTSKPSCNKF